MIDSCTVSNTVSLSSCGNEDSSGPEHSNPESHRRWIEMGEDVPGTGYHHPNKRDLLNHL